MTLPQLRRRYLVSYGIAIGLIFIVSVFAHLATLHAVSHERGTAEIVNVSGKQRMLSQRLLALVETQSGQRAQEQNNALIRATADELETANVRLQAQAEAISSGDVRDELMVLFNEPEAGITALISEYVGIARSSLEGGASVEQRQRMEDLALGEMFVKLHHAVALFEEHAELGLNRISRIQLFQVALILLILAGEAVFIFRPLLNKTVAAMQTEQETRQIAEDALRFQTETLASKSRFLEQMKTTFFTPLAEAQEKLELAVSSDADKSPELVRDAKDAVTFAAKRAVSLTRSYETTSHNAPQALSATGK
ncbi:type IV pili methyl-accepting chemotaxis transducer N-terminal domain-containing protein [Oceanicaulis sp. LC35]|uniref:type IV pili methyl-accepting chemotaxis transducer N-terminal domain-containing protein n=1 Tax=Oceanicaulis sp. LC35 TaxID=3349635 RepID=UPI003F85F96E